MCVVVRMARIAGKENLFEVATCRLLNFGSPDFSNATTFPPQEKDDCNRKAEGSYQAPRTGIESSPRGRRRPHTPRGGMLLQMTQRLNSQKVVVPETCWV